MKIVGLIEKLICSALLICSAASAFASTPERLPLEGTWRLTQTQHKISIPAQVPGVQYAALLSAKLISDPYFGNNLASSEWAGDVPWSYSRSFTVSHDFLKHREIRLRCEGLDTLATVQINGKLVAHTDNMFRTWEFDAKPFLHAGLNSIEITFDPIEPYLDAHVNQTAFPGKTVAVHGWGYIRKAPYQPGWDFAPDLVTAGIWRGIGLVGWDDARLTDIGVVQDHSVAKIVKLQVSATADTQADVTARFTLLWDGKQVASAKQELAGDNGSATLTVKNPKLWWPAGMGAQPLYTLNVTLFDKQGHIVDSGNRSIGLRTLTWIAKTDTRPLTLEVNGVPFFAKGTNWVPCDSIMTRTTPAQLRQYVDNAVAANMNIMRLWGGGFYEDNALFDECDRKGLLLWSEFKFADSAYPAFDPAWLANTSAEVSDNVRRLRLHPCIAVWSGNNEVIGFVRDTTYSGAMSKEDYNLLFHQTIPGIIHSIDPNAIYTPGSPESGDNHDWSVWHGDSGFESYRDVHGFMSEFGFQAFPQPKSVEQFTAASDRTSVESKVMEFHQHNWRDGNLLILNTAKRYYHDPKDFDSALWLSQIQQADGILTGVESWRRDWPNSTGSMVWQYDDPWPAISWSMVDYYGRPKALYYRVAHAYAPVMLSGLANRSTDNIGLWVANDRHWPLKGDLTWKLVGVDGKIAGKGYSNVSIPSGTSSTQVLNLAAANYVDKIGPSNLVFYAELNVPGEPISRTTLAFENPKQLNLDSPNIQSAVSGTGNSYTVTLASSRPALDAWVDLTGIDAKFSDNFVTLIPGQSVQISIAPSAKTSLAQIRSALRVRSLFDTYLPGSGPTILDALHPDGSVVVSAETAEINGDIVAHLEFSNPGDIGNWQDVNDSLHWWVKNVPAGKYSVIVNLSCPPGEGGSTFAVKVGSESVNGTVPETAGWTDYKDVTLGTVNITASGSAQIVVQPLNKPSVHVMNLRTVSLVPVTGN